MKLGKPSRREDTDEYQSTTCENLVMIGNCWIRKANKVEYRREASSWSSRQKPIITGDTR